MQFRENLTKNFAALAIVGATSAVTPAQADGFDLRIDLGNGNSIGIDVDSNGQPRVDLNVEGGSFTYGNGEKSTANWQACRNDAVASYNEKVWSDRGVTAQDTARHQQRLQNCDKLYP